METTELSSWRDFMEISSELDGWAMVWPAPLFSQD
jgi:hypothetical protein